jgi:hypothetical protein
VRQFLQRISTLIESGFGEAQIQQACQLAESMEHDAEQRLEFPISYAGRDSLLCIGTFMDDINAPDVYFFSPPALAAQIDVEMEMFFDEMGM